MRQALARPEMQDTILDAANRLMERYGYKKMTMDDLAQEAGIGKGTIYLHFRSKEEVALSCMEMMKKRIHAELCALARGNGSPVERLHTMLVRRVMMRFDAVQGYARSLDDLLAALRPQFLARRERWLAEEAEIFAEVLIEGRLHGTFAVEEALNQAMTLLLATNALMPFSLSPRELGERAEVLGKAESLAAMLLHGVLARNREVSE